MKYIVSFLWIFLVSTSFCKAQNPFTDTVSVFTYNINNYGYASTKSCPLEGSPLKNGYLINILRYAGSPDVIAFEKFIGTPTTLASDSMQRAIMDSVCAGCYANTTFTNVSGYKKVNTLFYKKSKFGYLGTTTIYSADNSISDINLHKLYYKSPSLAATKDTTFLNVIVVHTASGASSDAQRGTEISGAMSWLSANVKTAGNYIFLGDFNTQNSSESCFQAMINPTNTTIKFNDPPNQLGDWAGSPKSFAKYLTQSTRTTDPGDCASTNTMLTRFDHILCSNPIMQGTKRVQYIPNSYKVIGQDGLHTGLAIIDAPTNTSVPANVLNSLYMMSEHLPVLLKLQVTSPNPLPIGFDYFKVSLKNNKPFLQWQTNNNASATVYEIERSDNGSDYKTINQTINQGLNTCAYNFSDLQTIDNKVVYYRIKETLKTGSYLYSNVVSIQVNNNIHHITISPNPVKCNLSLTLQSNDATDANIYVLNTLGQTCVSEKVALQAGANSIFINNLERLAKGVYILKLQSANATESKLFIKD